MFLIKQRAAAPEQRFSCAGGAARHIMPVRGAAELAGCNARSNFTRSSMSDFDRSANARYGAGVARSGVSAVDQGLRAYMIGVYNYMTLGLGVTGLIALGAFKLGVVEDAAGRITGLTDIGHAMYVSPLRWLIVLSPLAVVFYITARISSMSVASARNAFIAFAALIGLSM